MQRALKEQLLSHWMFEMMAGFDLFNDWYDADLLEPTDEMTQNIVVVEQSPDELRISNYRIISQSDRAGMEILHCH